MPDNDRVLLDSILEQYRHMWNPSLSVDDAFEFFASEQVLKDADLSVDELQGGVVGGNGDGGIDSVFTFLDQSLLAEDSSIFGEDFDADSVRPDVSLSLHLVQSKTTPAFDVVTLTKVSETVSAFFDLDKSDLELRKMYSEELIARFSLFRDALRIVGFAHPSVSVTFHYATRGESGGIHSRVRDRAELFEEQFSSITTGAKGLVIFHGATELYRLSGRAPKETLQLLCQETATSESSYVALVTLKEFFRFITDENGGLNAHIFEGNVRAFQGYSGVNREIRQSLNEQGGPDFWWLNNGVTVICSRVFSQGKQFNLDDVQIVNGLQTSYSVFQAGRENGTSNLSFSRLLLVRIIETEDGEVKDNIIRATNRQTAVSEASLKATDELQRKIERLFEGRGLYYDRRKNYYRNENKPRDKIVSINALAQAVMAMGLSRPDDARARPSDVFRDDEEYEKVFHDRVPIEIYLWAARTQREVNRFLQTTEADADWQERTNLRFYVSMLVAARRLGKRVRGPGELAPLVEGPPVAEGEMEECLRISREVMARMTEEEGDLPDRVAKGPRFTQEVLAAVGL